MHISENQKSEIFLHWGLDTSISLNPLTKSDFARTRFSRREGQQPSQIPCERSLDLPDRQGRAELDVVIARFDE